MSGFFFLCARRSFLLLLSSPNPPQPQLEPHSFSHFFFLVCEKSSFAFFFCLCSARRKGKGAAEDICLSPFSFLLSLSRCSLSDAHFFLFSRALFFQNEKKRKEKRFSSFAFFSFCSRFHKMQGWGALLGPEAPGDYYDGVVRKEDEEDCDSRHLAQLLDWRRRR